jgi:large subunit ribosomal protein L13
VADWRVSRLVPRVLLRLPFSVRRTHQPSRQTTEDTSAVRTYSPKPGEIARAWHVIDATDVVLGRLASQVAQLLRGKHKPQYAPHVDVGDFVVIVNAGKVALTGQKRENKVAYRHSGHPGGLKTINVGDQLRTHPDRVVERAIKGMLPHNTLGRQMLSKLKVYAGPEHPHAAQQPQTFEIKQVAHPDRRSPQGSHRARAAAAGHRPVHAQRPHHRGLLPEQGAPAAHP